MKRKRSTPKYPRETYLTFKTSGVVDQINVTYDARTGGFEFPEADPATVQTKVRYERASGKEKVVASVPANLGVSAFNLLAQLKRQVAYLVAVDTNTKMVGGRRLSVSTACFVPGRLANQGNPIAFDPLCAYAIFDAAPEANPERIGWHLLIRNHILPARLANEERVGVVVDSELSLLPAINSGDRHYYADHPLPPGVVMLYGTSDSGSDTLLNAMIRHCDKYATLMLEQVAARLGNLPELSRGDDNYAGHLAIHFKR